MINDIELDPSAVNMALKYTQQFNWSFIDLELKKVDKCPGILYSKSCLEPGIEKEHLKYIVDYYNDPTHLLS